MFVKNNYIIITILLTLLFSLKYKSQLKTEEIAHLNIPDINLNEKIYSKDSKYNQLKYGLYLLPDSTNENIIIASHSGNAKISHFKNLEQMKINDEIKIIYKNEIYLFRIVDIYEEEKNGKVKINKYNEKTLSLVTCKKNTNHLHLIISAIYSGKLVKNT